MEEDYYKLVQDKKAEMQSLHSRMDADKEQVFGKYKMKNLDGAETPQVYNVTLNKAKVFTARANAILSSAIQQPVIEGEGMDDKKTTLIEEFQEDMGYEIDRRLANRGIPGMFPFVCEQVNQRGRIAGRCTLRIDKKTGRLLPDVIPLDARYFYCEEGVDDMLWGAAETTRSKARIKAEHDYDIQDATAQVIDFWNTKHNQVFIGEESPKGKRPNKYGYPPFVLSIVPSGSMLQDADMVEHRGESILALDRDLYPELNLFASVLQTLTVMSFRGALQYANEAGSQAEKPEKPPFGVDVVIPTGVSDFFKRIPVNDINQAAKLMYAMLEGAIQQGSLSDIFYGNLRFPLSGAALNTIFEPAQMIFLPRLQALAVYYQQLYHMIIRQYIAIGKKLSMGEHYRMYNPGDLKGEYTLKYTYFSSSPLQDMANVSTAQAYGELISDDTKRRDVLKMKDPDGEEKKINLERANKLEPVLELFDEVHALIEESLKVKSQQMNMKAKILANRVVALLKQEPTEQPKQQAKANDQALPMFPKDGRTAPKSEEEKLLATAIEEEK